MTKEDILIDVQRRTDPYIGFTYTDPAIFAAMDEYAKQQAIAFAIDYARRVLTWINVNHMKPEDVANDRMEERYDYFIENQFIEQQNKNHVE